MVKASDFKNKEVINLANNEKMGFVTDFEICTTNGEIAAILVPEKNKIFISSKNSLTRIPWANISGIGEDIILVNVQSDA
ncbi:MAG: YlmC/YmxH family sporulation protein [Clostridia bacterium]|nr:YlmC/YmxH family sporulation protein [Clostridia bacterium]